MAALGTDPSATFGQASSSSQSNPPARALFRLPDPNPHNPTHAAGPFNPAGPPNIADPSGSSATTINPGNPTNPISPETLQEQLLELARQNRELMRQVAGLAAWRRDQEDQDYRHELGQGGGHERDDRGCQHRHRGLGDQSQWREQEERQPWRQIGQQDRRNDPQHNERNSPELGSGPGLAQPPSVNSSVPTLTTDVVGLFDPSSAKTGADVGIIQQGKVTLYTDVFLFTDRLQALCKIYPETAVRTLWTTCLRGDALMWHSAELTDMERELIADESIATIVGHLTRRFQERLKLP
jgi:hypothetical protein